MAWAKAGASRKVRKEKGKAARQELPFNMGAKECRLQLGKAGKRLVPKQLAEEKTNQAANLVRKEKGRKEKYRIQSKKTYACDAGRNDAHGAGEIIFAGTVTALCIFVQLAI